MRKRRVGRWGTLRLLLVAIGIGLIGIMPVVAQRDTIRTGVDLVVVPVSVRDSKGELVYDLEKEDFSVFEDGRLQEIRQFSVDQSPLSVAVLLDSTVEEGALRRFADSIGSLSSAFTPIDETGVYRFDNKVVLKLSDFARSHDAFENSLSVVQKMAGRRGNWSSSLVFFPGRGSRWLRSLLDRNAEARIPNNAVLAAAADLEKRRPENRKIIIVYSDGQSAKTILSTPEVFDRLVGSQIQFYGVTASVPLTEGTTSFLRTYADATGGHVYSGMTQDALQRAFLTITEQVRREYVLTYISNNEISGVVPVVRKIEVRMRTSGFDVRHRDSYRQYPPLDPQPKLLREKITHSATLFALPPR
jgi:VWFA-related protein